jgi:type II secretory pathway pseudopilin PulG
MRTFSTAMPTETCKPARCRTVTTLRRRLPAFTLIEAVVMTIILGLLTGLVMLNVSGIAFASRFSTETTELVSMLRLACNSAMQGNRRYEMKFDLAQQSYLLRTLTPANYGQPVEDEEIIDQRQLDEHCRLLYVEFDDGVSTSEEFSVANFRAGRVGWQRGGRILLADRDGQEYSIMISRLTGSVTLKKGDVQILVTQDDTAQ